MERRQRFLRTHSYSMVVRTVVFVVRTAPAVSGLSALITGSQIVAPLALLVICVFRPKLATDSNKSRPPIPESAVH